MTNYLKQNNSSILFIAYVKKLLKSLLECYKSNAIDELSTQAPHVDFEKIIITTKTKIDILRHLVLNFFDRSYQWI